MVSPSTHEALLEELKKLSPQLAAQYTKNANNPIGRAWFWALLKAFVKHYLGPEKMAEAQLIQQIELQANLEMAEMMRNAKKARLARSQMPEVEGETLEEQWRNLMKDPSLPNFSDYTVEEKKEEVPIAELLLKLPGEQLALLIQLLILLLSELTQLNELPPAQRTLMIANLNLGPQIESIMQSVTADDKTMAAFFTLLKANPAFSPIVAQYEQEAFSAAKGPSSSLLGKLLDPFNTRLER